jgi:hypothetical protein
VLLQMWLFSRHKGGYSNRKLSLLRDVPELALTTLQGVEAVGLASNGRSLGGGSAGSVLLDTRRRARNAQFAVAPNTAIRPVAKSLRTNCKFRSSGMTIEGAVFESDAIASAGDAVEHLHVLVTTREGSRRSPSLRPSLAAGL